jgi:hypothetical protein
MLIHNSVKVGPGGNITSFGDRQCFFNDILFDIQNLKYAAYHIQHINFCFSATILLMLSIGNHFIGFKYGKKIWTSFTFVVFKQYQCIFLVEFLKAYTCHVNWQACWQLSVLILV